MQEKSTIMSIIDLPLIKDIDFDSANDLFSPIPPLETPTASSAQSQDYSGKSTNNNDLFNFSVNSSHLFPSSYNKSMNMEGKHDTRVVNEAFQVIKIFRPIFKGYLIY